MISKFIVVAALACASVTAQASVIVDKSPDTTGFASNFTASNYAVGQNFLMGFSLGAATTLTGFDIYSDCNSLGCTPIVSGSPVVVKFTTDIGGTPDFANMQSFAKTLSAVDSLGSTATPSVQRYHVDIVLPVAAGNYWFGVSGNNIELGLSLGPVSTGPLWILNGNTGLANFTGYYGTAFNVYGGAVPEPANWAMLITGFGLTGAALRRRRSTAVAA